MNKKVGKTHSYTPACFRHVSTVLHGMIKDSPSGKVTVSFTDREPCPISEACENEAVFKVVIPKNRSKSKAYPFKLRYCDQCGAHLL
jgi:hypothetical protein